MKKLIHTIRGRLVIYFMIVLLVMSIILSLFQYLSFSKLAFQNTVNIYEANLKFITQTIDERLNICNTFIEWCQDVTSFDDFWKISEEDSRYNLTRIKTHQTLNSRMFNLSITPYIVRVTLIRNDKNYIQIGPKRGSIRQNNRLAQKDYTQLYHLGSTIEYGEMNIIPSSISSGITVYSIIKPVYSLTEDKVIGTIAIEINSDIIGDLIVALEQTGENKTYVMNKNNQYIAHTDREKIGGIYNKNEVKESRPKGYTVEYTSPISKLKIVQEINNIDLQKQKNVMYQMLGISVMIALLISGVTSIYMSTLFTKPIQELYKRIKYIGKGNLVIEKRDYEIDEIGAINRGIDEMVESINNLMEDNINQAKRKKDLELKVLQNQITPHFLYNTLNSIKWMAIMQGAKGIAEVTTSLSRLLKNVAKGTDDEIEIKEELSLLNDYIIIQKCRYANKFEFICDVPEEFSQYRIIKFTLQPIVENAIFHGIEPKEGPGKIYITIEEDEESIIISVKDDGVGMSKEDCEALRQHITGIAKETKNSIGIKNVYERIRIKYGPPFGISVESQLEQGTTVLVKLPKL